MNEKIFDKDYINSNAEDSDDGLSLKGMLNNARSKIYVLHNRQDYALSGSTIQKLGVGKSWICLYLARSLKLATFVLINYHLHVYLLFKINDMLLGRLGQAGAKENKLHEQLKGKVESLDCGEKWLNWGHNFGKYPLWLSYTVLYIFE